MLTPVPVFLWRKI